MNEDSTIKCPYFCSNIHALCALHHPESIPHSELVVCLVFSYVIFHFYSPIDSFFLAENFISASLGLLSLAPGRQEALRKTKDESYGCRERGHGAQEVERAV